MGATSKRTDKSPNLSITLLIIDFINTIGQQQTFGKMTHAKKDRLACGGLAETQSNFWIRLG